MGRMAGKGEHGAGRDGLLSSEVTSCGLMRNGAGLKARFLPPLLAKKVRTQLYQSHVYRLLYV